MTEVTISKTKKLKGEVCAPASKAYTQRMLIAAALSEGTSEIVAPLVSDDTHATLRAAIAIGAKVSVKEGSWRVDGSAAPIAIKEPIDCGESGATLRFMIPVAALAAEPSEFVLGDSLKKRPIKPLLESLKQLGAGAQIKRHDEKTSIVVRGGGITGGNASIRGDVSSQFISGLLFACPKAQMDTNITLTTPLESKGYVQMTQNVLAEHHVEVSVYEDFRRLFVLAKQEYQPFNHIVPGDFSSGAFLLAAAAVTCSKVRIKNLDPRTLQGDRAILGILEQMGSNVKVCNGEVAVVGTGDLLDPLEVDARDIPDLVPVCASLACYARGTSIIHDAQRLRYKESDRLLSLHMELRKMGAEISMDTSSLTIKGPCALRGSMVDPHRDHRIAMACAIAALGADGKTIIQDAGCVRKSYPRFFHDLRILGADVSGGELHR